MAIVHYALCIVHWSEAHGGGGAVGGDAQALEVVPSDCPGLSVSATLKLQPTMAASRESINFCIKIVII